MTAAPMCRMASIVPLITSTTVPGPYVIPAFHLDVTVAFTNKLADHAGPGRGPAAGGLRDGAADGQGGARDRHRPRRPAPPQSHPARADALSGGSIFRDGAAADLRQRRFSRGVRQGARPLGLWRGFSARARRRRARQGRYIGIGIGSYVEGTGLGPFEGATLRVLPSGKVRLISGASPQGQGHQTSFAQIAADHLGIAPDAIDVVLADTDAIAMGYRRLCEPARRQCRPRHPHRRPAACGRRSRRFAALSLEVAEEDIELADGRAHVKGVPQLRQELLRAAR